MDNKEDKELENLALQKVLEVSSAIDAAKQVDEVICALHSLATLIFSVDSSLISGPITSPKPYSINKRLLSALFNILA